MAFQEIVIDPDFERVLTDFMKHHWAVFEEGYGDKEAQTKVFHLYRAEIQKYIENVPNQSPRTLSRKCLISTGQSSAIS